MIAIWVDVRGRLWIDTGEVDEYGEMIIELIDGSQQGTYLEVALHLPGGLKEIGASAPRRL